MHSSLHRERALSFWPPGVLPDSVSQTIPTPKRVEMEGCIGKPGLERALLVGRQGGLLR